MTKNQLLIAEEFVVLRDSVAEILQAIKDQNFGEAKRVSEYAYERSIEISLSCVKWKK